MTPILKHMSTSILAVIEVHDKLFPSVNLEFIETTLKSTIDFLIEEYIKAKGNNEKQS